MWIANVFMLATPSTATGTLLRVIATLPGAFITRCGFFNIVLPEASPTIHMIMMAVLARLVVDLNFRGWQMAYQRSMEIDVSVMTDTVTETVCKKKNENILKIFILIYLSDDEKVLCSDPALRI